MHFKVLPETITSEASWVRETLGPRHTAGLGGDLEMRVAMPTGLNKNKPNTNSKPQHPPHPTTQSLTTHTLTTHTLTTHTLTTHQPHNTTYHTTIQHNTYQPRVYKITLPGHPALFVTHPSHGSPDMLTKLCLPKELLRAITDT